MSIDTVVPVTVESSGSSAAATPQPAAPGHSKAGPNALALWIARRLLEMVRVKDPLDSWAEAIARFIVSFAALLIFGPLVPLYCAFLLRTLDRFGGDSIADAYRDDVVSGFRINESIYRADRERIDYLFQMRHVNFLEDDSDGSDPSVSIIAIPGQQGQLWIDRATLIKKEVRSPMESGGTAPASATPPLSKCHAPPNPELRNVQVTIGDASIRKLAVVETIQVGSPFELDKKFWSSLKMDPASESLVKSLKVSVAPMKADQTSDCFDLFVDLRVNIYKTKSK